MKLKGSDYFILWRDDNWQKQKQKQGGARMKDAYHQPRAWESYLPQQLCDFVASYVELLYFCGGRGSPNKRKLPLVLQDMSTSILITCSPHNIEMNSGAAGSGTIHHTT
jgi:hypothetical protein